MKIHWYQHVPFEGLGWIRSWVEKNNHQATVTHFYKNETPPVADSVDMLIVMGGPMSVHDEHTYRWLCDEKRYIDTCINRGIPVLGICLGAQLIASVLGAKVYKNEQAEIGWHNVKLTEKAVITPCVPWPNTFTVFQWHGETFDIPQRADHVAWSSACKNQAFIYNKNVLGLQFHLETTHTDISNLVENCANDLVQQGQYIQPTQEITSCTSHFTSMHCLIEKTLDFLVS